MTLPVPTRAFADLAAYLVARHRRDLLTPLANAVAVISTLAALIEVARQQANGAEATRLRAESMRTRAAFEHALFRVQEAICDEPDGSDLVGALLGRDGDRLLADILLNDE